MKPSHWLVSCAIKFTVSTGCHYKCLLATSTAFVFIHKNTPIFAFSVMRISGCLEAFFAFEQKLLKDYPYGKREIHRKKTGPGLKRPKLKFRNASKQLGLCYHSNV